MVVSKPLALTKRFSGPLAPDVFFFFWLDHDSRIENINDLHIEWYGNIVFWRFARLSSRSLILCRACPKHDPRLFARSHRSSLTVGGCEQVARKFVIRHTVHDPRLLRKGRQNCMIQGDTFAICLRVGWWNSRLRRRRSPKCCRSFSWLIPVPRLRA